MVWLETERQTEVYADGYRSRKAHPNDEISLYKMERINLVKIAEIGQRLIPIVLQIGTMGEICCFPKSEKKLIETPYHSVLNY